MSPRELLESYALPLASFAMVVGLLAAWLIARRRERRRARERRSPNGPGVALALALDGDLAGARSILAGQVGRGGADALDGLVGLVAVLKAEGDLVRARALLDRLAARHPGAPWLDAMRLRLALDDGRLEDACRLVDGGAEVPLEMALAALGRAGRWADALRRYRQTVPRRQRAAETEAALAAGCAAELMRAGQPRSARRALKRALSLDPDGVLPLAVAADLHPRDGERHRLARALGQRLPGRHGEPPEPEALQSARRRWQDGEHEVALGLLRDHLEEAPTDWAVRRLYARWIVEVGTADDWRAELADLVGVLADGGDAAAPVECRRCGHVEAEPFAVCPRCDALGSLREVARRRDDVRRGMPSSAGAALSELMASADEDGAASPGGAG